MDVREFFGTIYNIEKVRLNEKLNIQGRFINFPQKFNKDKVKFLIRANEFKKLSIQNYKYNRNPDIEKIKEIKNRIEKQRCVDGIIYLFIKNNEVYCYDGFHRANAIQFSNLEYEDIECQIIYNPIEEQIYDEFVALNKCDPITDTLLDKLKVDLYKRIEQAVDRIQTINPEMFKTKETCRNPHLNRGKFIQSLNDIALKRKSLYSSFTVDEWVYKLNEVNKEIKENEFERVKLSKNQREKCQKYDFYLGINNIFVNYL